eukprot:367320_1
MAAATDNDVSNNYSRRVKTMRMLMLVKGCREKDAFYITQKFPTIGLLHRAWDSIIETEEKSNRNVNRSAAEMLHHEIFVYEEWKYKYDLYESGEVKTKPDTDILQCIIILNKSGFDD